MHVSDVKETSTQRLYAKIKRCPVRLMETIWRKNLEYFVNATICEWKKAHTKFSFRKRCSSAVIIFVDGRTTDYFPRCNGLSKKTSKNFD